MSHKRELLSSLPVARHLPSGLKAIANGMRLFLSQRSPRIAISSSGCQAKAARGIKERHRCDPGRTAGRRAMQRPGWPAGCPETAGGMRARRHGRRRAWSSPRHRACSFRHAKSSAVPSTTSFLGGGGSLVGGRPGRCDSPTPRPVRSPANILADQHAAAFFGPAFGGAQDERLRIADCFRLDDRVVFLGGYGFGGAAGFQRAALSQVVQHMGDFTGSLRAVFGPFRQQAFEESLDRGRHLDQSFSSLGLGLEAGATHSVHGLRIIWLVH